MKSRKIIRFLFISFGSMILLIALAVVALKWYINSERYISVDEVAEYLQTHRGAVETLVGEFGPLKQVFFVVTGPENGFSMSVMDRDTNEMYFVANPLEADARPIWEQPFDSIRDNRLGLSLQHVLDSSDVDRSQFARIVELLQRNKLYGIEHAEDSNGVDIRIKELTGLAYRHHGISDHFGSGLDSSVQIEKEWYWFLKM